MFSVLISLRSLVQGCNIRVFWESVNRPFAIFSNVSNKHFSIQTLKILLKHPMAKYTIAISQGQRYNFADLETCWQQYLGTGTKYKISVI